MITTYSTSSIALSLSAIGSSGPSALMPTIACRANPSSSGSVTAGSFDLLAEVLCESDDHLLRILSDRIRSIEGVKATETFVYLKLVKQTY